MSFVGGGPNAIGVGSNTKYMAESAKIGVWGNLSLGVGCIPGFPTVCMKHCIIMQLPFLCINRDGLEHIEMMSTTVQSTQTMG